MTDLFDQHLNDRGDPFRHAAAVTPSDSADLSFTTRALYIGGNGNVKVNFAGSGDAVTLTGVVAGTIYPVCVERVYSTDTTATSIVALW